MPTVPAKLRARIAPFAWSRANQDISRGGCRFRIGQFRVIFQRPRDGRTSSRIGRTSVSAPRNDLQILHLFSFSLPVQLDSSRCDGERRIARNGGRAESRAEGGGKYPIEIFPRASDVGSRSRGITSSDRWLARVGRRPQCASQSGIQRSWTKSGISWNQEAISLTPGFT